MALIIEYENNVLLHPGSFCEAGEKYKHSFSFDKGVGSPLFEGNSGCLCLSFLSGVPSSEQVLLYILPLLPQGVAVL